MINAKINGKWYRCTEIMFEDEIKQCNDAKAALDAQLNDLYSIKSDLEQ